MQKDVSKLVFGNGPHDPYPEEKIKDQGKIHAKMVKKK
jgi:hypothetical protein